MGQLPSPATPTRDIRTQNWLASLLLRQHQTWFGRFTLQLQRLFTLQRGQRRRLERKAAVSLAGAALVLSLGAGMLRPPAVHAASMTVDNGVVVIADDGYCSIKEAIINANNDGQLYASVGECAIGSGPDTVNLPAAGLFTLTGPYSPYDYYSSNIGLPPITSDITIAGNGSTIQRDTTAADFRIMVVTPTGDLKLNDTTIKYGVSQKDGGGLFLAGPATINNSDIISNIAEYGGGIYSFKATVTIENGSTIGGNYAQAIGGGADFELSNVTITDSTISENSGYYGGGGIFGAGSTVTIERSLISDNHTSGALMFIFGGGVANVFAYDYVINDTVPGDMTIIDSTISGNSAVLGGGIGNLLNSSLKVQNSTISGNTAIYGGGGLMNYRATWQITNSTFSGNQTYNVGGAIFNIAYGLGSEPNDLLFSTVTDNTASSAGGGIINAYGVIYMAANIVSGNTSPAGAEIFNDSVIVPLYNVLGDNSKTSAQAFDNFVPDTSDVVATSDGTLPTVLGAIRDSTLQNNGGLTETHALVSGSPAIDYIDSTACVGGTPYGDLNEDQRHYLRPIDIPGTGSDTTNLCDVGAYEMQPPGVGLYCPIDPNVGNVLTSAIGTGQGNPTKGYRTRKLVVPNLSELDSLYGQLAAVDVGVMKYVRFLPQGYPKVQIHAPTSPAYRPFAVDWWGTDLPTDATYVKGQFFWGAKANKSPRAFVLWPTHTTTEEYANVFATFDDSSTNHVSWETGFIPSQVQTLTIPATTAAGATVNVTVALVDINKDGRSVILTVEAGGVSEVRTITLPNSKDLLNLEEFALVGVPAGTDEVTITLESPAPSVLFPDGGDSAAMIGAAANYMCDPDVLRSAGESEATAVGDWADSSLATMLPQAAERAAANAAAPDRADGGLGRFGRLFNGQLGDHLPRFMQRGPANR